MIADFSDLRMPEGLLSLLKDRMISNARLCRAACELGLDEFVVTQQLSSKKWRPPYVSDLREKMNKDGETRWMSTKTLADVVEAMIGISYLDGGLTKALTCIRLFVSESQANTLESSWHKLFSAVAPKNMIMPADLRPVEGLIGHEFREKALLTEAMTHPSYNLRSTVACFDRLEFIGDAILDYVIVQEVFGVQPPLENWQMHLLRTALVNADILGFFIMEWSYKQSRFDVRVSESDKPGGKPQVDLSPGEVDVPLWTFMRQSSAELTFERAITQARHAEMRQEILEAIHLGAKYPWALLSRLHAQKFYSDLFEALLAAVWIDSGPTFDRCKAFVERSGVLPYLRRLLRDEVHILHPKEELGRLADKEEVEYLTTHVDGTDERRGWSCEVRIGEVSVASVHGCLFREEARVSAATLACEILRGKNARDVQSDDSVGKVRLS